MQPVPFLEIVINKSSGDEYIVKISNATVTYDSRTMTTADIYILTHLQPGQKATRIVVIKEGRLPGEPKN